MQHGTAAAAAAAPVMTFTMMQVRITCISFSPARRPGVLVALQSEHVAYSSSLRDAARCNVLVDD